ncbi:MAG: type VI secretion system protein TssA [Alphaproteobacteria bacterium]
MAREIDPERLLLPVSAEAPAGAEVAMTAAMEQIEQASAADEALPQGDWQTELKTADWPKVVDLCVAALTRQGKDLQVAAALVTALGNAAGEAGLAQGFAVVEGLLARFWDGLHPLPEDGELDARAGRLARLDRPVTAILRTLPVTAGEEGGWTLRDWQGALRLETLAGQEREGSREAIRELLDAGARSKEDFAKAVAQTPAGFFGQAVAATETASAAFDAMRAVIDEKLGDDAPRLADTRAAFEERLALLRRFARERGVDLTAAGAPSAGGGETAAVPFSSAPAAMATVGAMAGAAMAGAAAPGGAMVMAGPIQGREHALRLLGDVADWFLRTEPHSPVSYLVQRAARWGRGPLDGWLAEVVKDDQVLRQIRETLGITPPRD